MWTRRLARPCRRRTSLAVGRAAAGVFDRLVEVEFVPTGVPEWNPVAVPAVGDGAGSLSVGAFVRVSVAGFRQTAFSRLLGTGTGRRER